MLISTEQSCPTDPARLFSSPGLYFRKNAAGGYDRVQVTTGLSDGVNIEIKSGLSVGDKLRGPRIINTDEDEKK